MTTLVEIGKSKLASHAVRTSEELSASVFPVKVQPDLEHPGKSKKIPLVKGWANGAAVSKAEGIEALFAAHPEATHVAIQTGQRSRLLVVDIDGEQGMQWWIDNKDMLPVTYTVRTRRANGYHLYFRLPTGVELRNSAGKIAAGVDIRASGGFVVDWSSETGKPTEEVADAPAALIALIRGVGGKITTQSSREQAGIPEGKRNSELSRLAGQMRRAGWAQDRITVALQAVNSSECNPALDSSEVDRIAASIARYATDSSNSGLELRGLSEIIAERREPEWLLRNILERGILAVIAGVRGTFKSFVALEWALRSALAGHAVVILSGEGGGLDRRADAWLRTHAPTVDLNSLPVVALERAINLNSQEVIGELAAAIDASGRPDLVVIDTLSKFSPGLDENDNAEVAAFLSALSATLRDNYGCTVLIVAHAGHGDAKRPRGASALMANPDAEYIVEPPDPAGMLCTVTRERFKDSPSLPPLAYAARVVDLGRVDRYGEPVTSLVLDSTDAPPVKAKGAWGSNQMAVIVALREWSRANPGVQHVSTLDVTGLLKSQGIGSKRKYEVLNSLVNARILTPSIGGYTFDAKAL